VNMSARTTRLHRVVPRGYNTETKKVSCYCLVHVTHSLTVIQQGHFRALKPYSAARRPAAHGFDFICQDNVLVIGTCSIS